MQIKDKIILVTGATSGIGKALVQSLLSSGAIVAFCGRSQDKLDAFKDELLVSLENSFSRAFDATNLDAVRSFVTDVCKILGPVDVLVNCAGANSVRGSVATIDPNELDAAIRLNCLSPFVFMQQVYQQSMQGRERSIQGHGRGKIINVLSTVCQFSNEGIGAYTASKASFDALTKVFRKEVREEGIKVCSIYPGGVNTPFREADRPQYLDANAIVEAINYIIGQDQNICVDELVVRPLIEKNYC